MAVPTVAPADVIENKARATGFHSSSEFNPFCARAYLGTLALHRGHCTVDVLRGAACRSLSGSVYFNVTECRYFILAD